MAEWQPLHFVLHSAPKMVTEEALFEILTDIKRS